MGGEKREIDEKRKEGLRRLKEGVFQIRGNRKADEVEKRKGVAYKKIQKQYGTYVIIRQSLQVEVGFQNMNERRT